MVLHCCLQVRWDLWTGVEKHGEGLGETLVQTMCETTHFHAEKRGMPHNYTYTKSHPLDIQHSLYILSNVVDTHCLNSGRCGSPS